MKIYYAHPMFLYGTPQEKRDIETLKVLGFEVINPADYEEEFRSKRDISALETYDSRFNLDPMSFWTDLACSCDALAFRAFPDGSIGAGIVEEIYSMRNKPVVEIPSGIQKRSLTVNETREILTELGQR